MEDDDIPQISNAMSVFPKPERMFPADARPAGGQYIDSATKQDVTGHRASMASVGVLPGGKPFFNVSRDPADEVGSSGRGAYIARTNLFKQRAGWKWLDAPEGHEDTNTIVSTLHNKKHFYSLNTHYPKGVDLARYPKEESEPKLKPTTRGRMALGNQVGRISVRGAEHPVYDHVIVKADGGIVGDPDTDEGITAYHGSPHDFEQFDTSKIGTGEGAQSYGHGLYFAGNEDVAKGYRDALSPQYFTINDKKTNPSSGPEGWAYNEIVHHMKTGKKDPFAEAKKSISDSSSISPPDKIAALKVIDDWIKKNPKVVSTGHMYEVHINAHPDHFLDWDKALWEQPEAIRRLAGWSPEHEKKYYDWQKNDTDSLLAALEGNGDHTPTRQPVRPQGSLPMSTKGSDIYEHIKNKFGAVDWPIDADAQTRATYRNGAAHRASQHLLEHGIKGIKYLDAGSRGASDKSTSNYVVFDDKLVNVKRKYAKGGTVQRSPKPVSDGSIVNRALMLTSKKA